MGRGEGCWGCLQLLPLDSEAHSIQFPPATGPRTLSLTLCPWASPSCAFDPLSVSNCLPLSPGLLVPACPRLIPSQANGAGETPLRVLGTPEPLLRLQRTWGVWQIPELDAQDAKALLELWPPGVSAHSRGPSLTLPDPPHDTLNQFGPCWLLVTTTTQTRQTERLLIDSND